MSADMSDDEFPDLATLLPPTCPGPNARRRSPRKVQKSDSSTTEKKSLFTISAGNEIASAHFMRPTREEILPKASHATQPSLSLTNVPVLPRRAPETEVSATSNYGPGRSPSQRPIGLPHVDSLLLPLSKICLDAEARRKQDSSISKNGAASKLTKSNAKPRPKQHNSQKLKSSTANARKFVLSEAHCVDDFENSLMSNEEDEDTDLSGFVVDDDVELSIHDSSTDSELDQRPKTKTLSALPKRRLQRGSKNSKPVEALSLNNNSGKAANSGDSLSDIFGGLKIDSKHKGKFRQPLEIIDLTSSPVGTHGEMSQLNSNTENSPTRSNKPRKLGEPINLFRDFDSILKFSPPCSNAPPIVPRKLKLKMESSSFENEPADSLKTSETHKDDGFKTPPATPPRSPSKLKSPSKLLSPSKGAAQVPQSPHRQSIEGFWDLEVVNTWNDTYSPKKEPIASPRKNRFLDWLDSGDEDDEKPTSVLNESSDSLPSPCSSPRKMRSPQRSPEKAEKQRMLEEKRVAKAKRQDFECRKEQFANTLMIELDTNITSSKLTALSSSTGGVQIIWSKTLRSTAGRASWRRTVVKPTGSPVKGSSVPDGSTVHHYASIELATKVIDCDTRLVNTLAHEFCHLANFMVSNVRDQPHGASFKAWAARVTKYLRAHDNPLYRGVEVTTKHSYAIDHKYLWVCAGREALGVLKNVPDVDDGCGAEYGRHSKSIDTEKHRCGRCKGALIQVRPKPRKVDPTRASPRKALFQKKKTVEVVTEAVEVVDLSD